MVQSCYSSLHPCPLLCAATVYLIKSEINSFPTLESELGHESCFGNSNVAKGSAYQSWGKAEREHADLHLVSCAWEHENMPRLASWMPRLLSIRTRLSKASQWRPSEWAQISHIKPTTCRCVSPAHIGRATYPTPSKPTMAINSEGWMPVNFFLLCVMYYYFDHK